MGWGQFIYFKWTGPTPKYSELEWQEGKINMLSQLHNNKMGKNRKLV